ncbi:MAG: adenylate/guanylate cyclase domain-containing protein, partial [Chloroflexota bacterium]
MTSAFDTTRACASFVPIDRRLALTNGDSLDGITEGCALFADLSGYTNLTAELTQQLGPEAGVELLASTLNQIYEVLIHTVHRHRGCVLTFAGDAITCWFANDDGFRALACAKQMRSNLQPFSRLVTPSGSSVPLQIKISIASGRGWRMMVGNAHINHFDIVVGHVIDRMALGEKCAERGDIVLSEELANHLDEHIQIKSWVEKENQRFAILKKISLHPPNTPWPALPAATNGEALFRTWLLYPIYDRLVSGQHKFVSEIRPVSALFLRFRGIQYEDNIHLEQQLREYISRIQETIHRFGGHLLQVVFGDKGSFIYAAFGCPVAHSREEPRAVAAAIALRNLKQEFPYIQSQQIGISYGSVYTGPYGSEQRQTYGIIGPEANIAARLMVEAEDDQILIPQDMANRLNQKIWAKYLGFTYIKGIRRSIKMFDVMEKIPNATSQTLIRFAVSPLGREQELNQLTQWLKEARYSHGRITSIIGENGTGKTHLVMSLSLDAAAQDVQVAIIPCDDTLQQPIFYPWREFLRSFTNLPTNKEIERDLDKEKELIFSGLIEANPDWRHKRLLFDVLFSPHLCHLSDDLYTQISIWIGEILRFWAQRGPLMLVIDDAHWIDPASLVIWNQVIQSIEVLPILAIACLHHNSKIINELTPKVENQIKLNPLPPDAVRYLVESHLGAKIASSLHQLILRQTAGNPAFIHQLIAQLRKENRIFLNEKEIWQLRAEDYQKLIDGGIIVKKGEGWNLNLNKSIPKKLLPRPNSTTAALLARYDRLPEKARVILKLGAANGLIFDINQIKKSY